MKNFVEIHRSKNRKITGKILIADEILEQLGEGTFGKVVKVVDRADRGGKLCALKIIKNVSKYRYGQ